MVLNRRSFLGHVGAGVATAAVALDPALRAAAPHRAAWHAAVHRARRDGEGLRRHAREGRGARLQGGRVRRLLQQVAAGSEGRAGQERADLAVNPYRLRPARGQVPDRSSRTAASSATPSSSIRGSTSAIRNQPGAWKRAAEAFNRAGEMASKAGLQFAYHNHHFEFVPVDGQAPLELMLKTCDPALVKIELDLCWTAAAGTGSGGLVPEVSRPIPDGPREGPEAASCRTRRSGPMAPPIQGAAAGRRRRRARSDRLGAHLRARQRKRASSTTSSSTISRRRRSTAWPRARSIWKGCSSRGGGIHSMSGVNSDRLSYQLSAFS